MTHNRDNIERSNLSRQLLFRTQDIGKPKSIAAAQAVQNMNPHVNIQARILMIDTKEAMLMLLET
jgi:molybdopterin/thiamine biosynthesis adenylyltransferase